MRSPARALIQSAALAFICLLAVPAAFGSDRDALIFGMLLVGPHNDHGWSQAHYEEAAMSKRSCLAAG